MQIGSAFSLPIPGPKSQPAADGTAQAREAAAQRKLDQARDALTKLTAMRDQQKQSAKAVARKKVDELRARLQAMKLIFANDPKALARAVAGLARELGAAVKGYAAAAGSGGETGAGSASLAGGAVDGGIGPSAAPSEGAAEPAEPAGAEAASTGEDAAKPVAAKTSDGDVREAEAYRQRLEQQRGDARGQGEQDDAAFARDSRDLARQIRAVMRGLKEKQADPRDAEAVKRALGGMEQDLGASAGGGGVPAPGSLLSLSA